ncbi:putative NBD/HSP70 family sugar kinase [Microbacterium sp. BK668]|nr:putative NBD/HSP70 family sugar kinase [Microbacterium sp. BK668]
MEIAQATGLTRAAVSNIVRALIDDGLVREVGFAQSTGGKRRTMLQISPEARCAVGVHVSMTGVTYVVTNMAGGMLGRKRTRGIGYEHPTTVVAEIANEFDLLLAQVGATRESLVGVGIVAAGPIDHHAGTVGGPAMPKSWRGFPLRDRLSEALGLRVLVDKDATAAAVGEFWAGHDYSPLAFACLYMDEGVGSGIVINGVALRGSASNAGEIGHVCIDTHGKRCECGNTGCLELYAAPSAVVAEARRSGFDFAGAEAGSDMRLFDEIARRAIRQDPAAAALIAPSAAAIAEGAVTLANVVDLDLIVLAGPGFAVAGALYIDAIRAAISRRFFARRVHDVEVRYSRSPRDAAALGASALVLQETLAPRAAGVHR